MLDPSYNSKIYLMPSLLDFLLPKLDLNEPKFQKTEELNPDNPEPNYRQTPASKKYIKVFNRRVLRK